ncbi:MAG: aquaporin [Candidatus Puniceispirillaceae bacterium]
MRQKLVSEFIGTLFLVATIIGSGIMAERLSGGNDGLALLGNTIATGAILYVLITIFVSISGAHFNPAISFVMFLRGEGTKKHFALYVLFQILGGICGTFLAHLMFDVPVLQLSENLRSGLSQYLSEMVASFGLVLTILLGVKLKADAVAMLVALYITAGYWFTASTSFANPAVTIARTLTDSFSGIYYGDTGFFILAQLVGGYLALRVFGYLDIQIKEKNT